MYIDGLDKEVAGSYFEELREKKAGRSGFYGAIKAKVNRKYNFTLEGTKEDKIPQDMFVRRADGVEIIIPAAWFNKNGSIKKGRKAEYKKLLGLE